MMYLYKVHLLCDFHTFFCFYFFTHRSLYSVPTLTLLPILPSRTPALSRKDLAPAPMLSPLQARCGLFQNVEANTSSIVNRSDGLTFSIPVISAICSAEYSYEYPV